MTKKAHIEEKLLATVHGENYIGVWASGSGPLSQSAGVNQLLLRHENLKAPLGLVDELEVLLP